MSVSFTLCNYRINKVVAKIFNCKQSVAYIIELMRRVEDGEKLKIADLKTE